MCLKLFLFTEIIVNINVNTKDYSYQFAAPKTPVAPRPLLVAVWETRCLETVDILMELGADTSVLFSSEPDKEKPKPLFFHVRSTSNDFSVPCLDIKIFCLRQLMNFFSLLHDIYVVDFTNVHRSFSFKHHILFSILLI